MRKALVDLAELSTLDARYRSTPPVPHRNLVRTALVAVDDRTSSSRRAKARDYIRHLEQVLQESPDTPINLSDLARLLNLERTHCCRVIREITGKLYTDWIREIRIKRARSLLLHPGLSITDVSLAVGYTDLTTFARNFRKESGMSPRAFRQQQLDNQA